MKIILSRKGLDSTSGKVPSPILLPDNKLCWIPIPVDNPNNYQYGELSNGEHSIGRIYADLLKDHTSENKYCHLDPDLDESIVKREGKWKACFGQCDSSQSHLAKCGVGIGDLFLFYGWFRQAEQIDGKWKYVKGAKDLHVIFGYMQIGEIYPVSSSVIPDEFSSHTHVRNRDNYVKGKNNNTLYVATDYLDSCNSSVGGAGLFNNYSDQLVLTSDEGNKRSLWKLPKWFYPWDDGKEPMTYNRKPNKWTKNDDHVLLQTPGRGQEFVLDCDDYPEAVDWARDFIINNQ